MTDDTPIREPRSVTQAARARAAVSDSAYEQAQYNTVSKDTRLKAGPMFVAGGGGGSGGAVVGVDLENVMTDILPTEDNLLDLGRTDVLNELGNPGPMARRWAELHAVSGTFTSVTSDTIQTATANPLAGARIIPGADNLHDMGTETRRWRNIYTHNLDIDGSLAVGDLTADDIEPNNDGDANTLGTPTNRWDSIHANRVTLGAGTTTDTVLTSTQISTMTIVPAISSQGNIGLNTQRWNNISAVNLDLTGQLTLAILAAASANITTLHAGDIVPLGVNAPHQLGTLDNRWDELWARTFNLTSGTVLGALTAGSVVPRDSAVSRTIGTESNPWPGIWATAGDFGGALDVDGLLTVNNNLHANNIIVDNIGADNITADNILPSANNSYDLGSNSRRWNTIYASTVNVPTISGLITLDLLGALTASNIIPRSGTGFALGLSTNRWDNLWAIEGSFSDELTVDGILTVNNNIHANNLIVDNIGAAIITSENHMPDTSATRNLGSNTRRWNNMWAVTVRASNVDPIVSGGSDIGSTSMRWDMLYVQSINMNGSITGLSSLTMTGQLTAARASISGLITTNGNIVSSGSIDGNAFSGTSFEVRGAENWSVHNDIVGNRDVSRQTTTAGRADEAYFSVARLIQDLQDIGLID